MNQRTPDRSFWRRHGRELLGVGLLALGIHDVFGAHGFLAMRRTQKEMEQLRGDIARLDKENGALAGQVKSLQTDPRAIERLARDMGMARPGEMIFKLPPAAPGSTTPSKPR